MTALPTALLLMAFQGQPCIEIYSPDNYSLHHSCEYLREYEKRLGEEGIEHAMSLYMIERKRSGADSIPDLESVRRFLDSYDRATD